MDVCGSSWFEDVSLSAAFRAKDAQEMPSEAVIVRSAVHYCNDVAFYGIYSPETHSMNIDNRPPHTATLTVLYTAGCGSLVI
jgi:hypothetical protein